MDACLTMQLGRCFPNTMESSGSVVIVMATAATVLARSPPDAQVCVGSMGVFFL